jgi:hypothetical protein
LGLLGQSGRQDIASPSMTLAQSNLYISLDYDLPVMTDDNRLGLFLRPKMSIMFLRESRLNVQ